MILRIVPSETERRVGGFENETIQRAIRRFRVEGALIIEDILDTSIVLEARRVFAETYSQYLLNGSNDENALRVGGRRLIITIKLESPFDDPQLFANPYLLSVLSAELGDDFVLGAFGVVCSMPSAPTQHRHHDGGILFPHSGFDKLLPAAAITVGIPLLEMNEVHGTTALWLGSHRDETRLDEQGIEPVVREGSCMLWDFRLMHGGTPNRGIVPRPLLYLTYCRPWFMEHLNFNKKLNPKQKPLLVRENLLSSLSEQHQRLLARAQEA